MLSKRLFSPKVLSRSFPLFQRRMKHHLMVGTWTPPGAIFTFEFDDETFSLEMIKRTPIPEDEPISWMTFDVFLPLLPKNSAKSSKHAKKQIYGASMKKWSSHTVKSPTEIIHNASHPMLHDRTYCSPSESTTSDRSSNGIKIRYEHPSNLLSRCQTTTVQRLWQPFL